jgi:hypothetical protein
VLRLGSATNAEGSWLARPAAAGPGGSLLRVAGVRGLLGLDAFVEEGFEDSRSQPFFEFEEDPDAREIDPAVPGEVADPEDPPDVLSL